MLRFALVSSILHGSLALFGNLTDVLNIVNNHASGLLTLKSGAHHEMSAELLSMHIRAELLDDYGCWCYRGRNNFGKGMGKPMDKFDEVCRHLYQAYECIYKDGPLNGAASCDPISQSQQGYEWEVEFEVSNMKITPVFSCTGDVHNWCELTVCEIDMMYTKMYLDLIMDGEEPDFDKYAHEDGFNAEKSCPTGGADTAEMSGSGGSGALGADGATGTGGTAGGATGNAEGSAGAASNAQPLQPYKKCCGMYPHRWVYRTDKAGDLGNRQCCDLEGEDNIGNTRSRTYMSDTHVCCGAHGVQTGNMCM